MRRYDVGRAALQAFLRYLPKRKSKAKCKAEPRKKESAAARRYSAMQAKKPDKKAVLKPRIKSIEQCVREAAALGLTYGQYVARGLDKE